MRMSPLPTCPIVLGASHREQSPFKTATKEVTSSRKSRVYIHPQSSLNKDVVQGTGRRKGRLLMDRGLQVLEHEREKFSVVCKDDRGKKQVLSRI